MIPFPASQLAACRTRDLRRAARPRRARHDRYPDSLRRQVGFALIEAGLRLVAGAAEPDAHTSS